MQKSNYNTLNDNEMGIFSKKVQNNVVIKKNSVFLRSQKWMEYNLRQRDKKLL
jgi:hypothetical protein